MLSFSDGVKHVHQGVLQNLGVGEQSWVLGQATVLCRADEVPEAEALVECMFNTIEAALRL